MKYCLGLDLGVGSIGSAIVELDKENRAKQIVDAGVRIFEVSEGAEERRIKRTMRKNLIRTRKRLELLAKKLCENKLWVDSTPEGTVKLSAKSPYKIRFDAVHEKLANPNYIGRAILHLQNIAELVLYQLMKKCKRKFLKKAINPSVNCHLMSNWMLI